MRTTKIITFSVPKAFENIILKYAALEHRTISEFLREAIRRYIAMKEVEVISYEGRKKTKDKKLKMPVVQKWIAEARKS